MTIYLLIHKESGKVYVGQTSKPYLSTRLAQHRLDGRRRQTPLYNAARKYGWNVFDVCQVSTASTAEQLSNLEKLWIIVLRATEDACGYNIDPGGRVSTLSEDGRNRLRQAALGNQRCKGICRSAETRKLMALAKSGENNPAKRPEVRARIAATLKKLGCRPPIRWKKEVVYG